MECKLCAIEFETEAQYTKHKTKYCPDRILAPASGAGSAPAQTVGNEAPIDSKRVAVTLVKQPTVAPQITPQVAPALAEQPKVETVRAQPALQRDAFVPQAERLRQSQSSQEQTRRASRTLTPVALPAPAPAHAPVSAPAPVPAPGPLQQPPVSGDPPRLPDPGSLLPLPMSPERGRDRSPVRTRAQEQYGYEDERGRGPPGMEREGMNGSYGYPRPYRPSPPHSPYGRQGGYGYGRQDPDPPPGYGHPAYAEGLRGGMQPPMQPWNEYGYRYEQDPGYRGQGGWRGRNVGADWREEGEREEAGQGQGRWRGAGTDSQGQPHSPARSALAGYGSAAHMPVRSLSAFQPTQRLQQVMDLDSGTGTGASSINESQLASLLALPADVRESEAFESRIAHVRALVAAERELALLRVHQDVSRARAEAAQSSTQYDAALAHDLWVASQRRLVREARVRKALVAELGPEMAAAMSGSVPGDTPFRGVDEVAPLVGGSSWAHGTGAGRDDPPTTTGAQVPYSHAPLPLYSPTEGMHIYVDYLTGLSPRATRVQAAYCIYCGPNPVGAVSVAGPVASELDASPEEEDMQGSSRAAGEGLRAMLGGHKAIDGDAADDIFLVVEVQRVVPDGALRSIGWAAVPLFRRVSRDRDGDLFTLYGRALRVHLLPPPIGPASLHVDALRRLKPIPAGPTLFVRLHTTGEAAAVQGHAASAARLASGMEFEGALSDMSRPGTGGASSRHSVGTLVGTREQQGRVRGREAAMAPSFATRREYADMFRVEGVVLDGEAESSHAPHPPQQQAGSVPYYVRHGPFLERGRGGEGPTRAGSVDSSMVPRRGSFLAPALGHATRGGEREPSNGAGGGVHSSVAVGILGPGLDVFLGLQIVTVQFELGPGRVAGKPLSLRIRALQPRSHALAGVSARTKEAVEEADKVLASAAVPPVVAIPTDEQGSQRSRAGGGVAKKKAKGGGGRSGGRRVSGSTTTALVLYKDPVAEGTSTPAVVPPTQHYPLLPGVQISEVTVPPTQGGGSGGVRGNVPTSSYTWTGESDPLYTAGVLAAVPPVASVVPCPPHLYGQLSERDLSASTLLVEAVDPSETSAEGEGKVYLGAALHTSDLLRILLQAGTVTASGRPRGDPALTGIRGIVSATIAKAGLGEERNVAATVCCTVSVPLRAGAACVGKQALVPGQPCPEPSSELPAPATATFVFRFLARPSLLLRAALALVTPQPAIPPPPPRGVLTPHALAFGAAAATAEFSAAAQANTGQAMARRDSAEMKRRMSMLGQPSALGTRFDPLTHANAPASVLRAPEKPAPAAPSRPIPIPPSTALPPDPDAPWLDVRHPAPQSRPSSQFGPAFDPSRECVDVFVDGARFLPDNVTISKAVVKVYTAAWEQVGSTVEGVAAPDSNMLFPAFQLGARYSPSDSSPSPVSPSTLQMVPVPSGLHPSCTLVIRIDTVEAHTGELQAAGYSLMNVFSALGMPEGQYEGHEQQADGEQPFCVCEGEWQLPLHAVPPARGGSFHALMLADKPRVPCATILVRIQRPTVRGQTGGGMGVQAVDDVFSPPPEYASRAYDSSRSRPSPDEVALYPRRQEVSAPTIRHFLASLRARVEVQAVTLGLQDVPTVVQSLLGSPRPIAGLSEKLLSRLTPDVLALGIPPSGSAQLPATVPALRGWCTARLGAGSGQPSGMLDYGYLSPYDIEAGFKVRVDAVRLLPRRVAVVGQGAPPSPPAPPAAVALTTAIHCITPPARYYGSASDASDSQPDSDAVLHNTHFAQSRDWSASTLSINCLRDGYAVHLGVPYSTAAACVIDVRALPLPTGVDAAPVPGRPARVGWTLVPLFDRFGEGYVARGAWSMPLFAGPVPAALLRAIDSATNPLQSVMGQLLGLEPCVEAKLVGYRVYVEEKRRISKDTARKGKEEGGGEGDGDGEVPASAAAAAIAAAVVGNVAGQRKVGLLLARAAVVADKAGEDGEKAKTGSVVARLFGKKGLGAGQVTPSTSSSCWWWLGPHVPLVQPAGLALMSAECRAEHAAAWMADGCKLHPSDRSAASLAGLIAVWGCTVGVRVQDGQVAGMSPIGTGRYSVHQALPASTLQVFQPVAAILCGGPVDGPEGSADPALTSVLPTGAGWSLDKLESTVNTVFAAATGLPLRAKQVKGSSASRRETPRDGASRVA